MSNVITLTLLASLGMLMSSCANKSSIEKTLTENPDIIVKVIEKNPTAILEALQKAASSMKEEMAKKRQQDEKKKMEESFNKPLVPNIAGLPVRGTAGAPLVLVEYSDFQCPFCGRAFGTVTELLNKYKGKIQFIYKHLPLSFHPQARVASEYYEAIMLQNKEKAFAFHDEIYKDVRKLQGGKKFLDSLAKKVGADVAKVRKDITSAAVKKRVDDDLKEAAKFGFQGTPGFLLNGVPVKGAYPTEHFVGIVDELVKRGKVKL